MSRETVYLEIVEGWLRDNRGIIFPEGSVDDLCDRIDAKIERLKAEIEQLKVQLVKIVGAAHNSDRWKS